MERAGDRALDEIDWRDRPSRPGRTTRTRPELEALILDIRRDLRETSILGEYGAAAIEHELEQRAAPEIPALRTIGRILERQGALDARRRIRRPPPPVGWYLPEVAAHRAELDSFDVIERIRLLGGLDLDILTGVSLHGGLIDAWPEVGLTGTKTVAALRQRWRLVGRPGYAQFDNAPRFIGGNRHPDSIGAVIRFCLAVEVVPVFAPPHESGFQAAIEAFNGRWQRKVWARFWIPTLEELRARNAAYVAQSRRRHAVRIEAAPARRALADDPIDLRWPPTGRLAFIRRTTDAGRVSVLGRWYDVDRRWVQRLVRAELDLDRRRLAFYALRRAEPGDQPLLNRVAYNPPQRWYRWPGCGDTY